jgi:hypothetical protein
MIDHITEEDTMNNLQIPVAGPGIEFEPGRYRRQHVTAEAPILRGHITSEAGKLYAEVNAQEAASIAEGTVIGVQQTGGHLTSASAMLDGEDEAEATIAGSVDAFRVEGRGREFNGRIRLYGIRAFAHHVGGPASCDERLRDA